MAVKDDDVIPSGSEVPEESGEATAKPESSQQTQEEPKPSRSVEELEQELASYKDQFENAQKTLGKHSNEVGELRQTVKALSEQLEAKKEEEPTIDYDAQEADLQEKFDTGEIDAQEYSRELRKLNRQRSTEETQKIVKGELAERDSREVQERFLKENPDFNDVVNSGVLDPILQANPMHDNMSAYYAYKAQEAKKAADEAEEARRTAIEAQKAGKVLGKQGEGVRDKPGQDRSPKGGVKSAMLEALMNSRAAQ